MGPGLRVALLAAVLVLLWPHAAEATEPTRLGDALGKAVRPVADTVGATRGVRLDRLRRQTRLCALRRGRRGVARRTRARLRSRRSAAAT
jgi:hypothetical protein